MGGGSLAIRSMVLNDGRGGEGLVMKGGRSSQRRSRNDGDEGGVEKSSSMGSRFRDTGGVSLEGCDRAGGGKDKASGVDMGVVKEGSMGIVGDKGGDDIGDDGGTIE